MLKFSNEILLSVGASLLVAGVVNIIGVGLYNYVIIVVAVFSILIASLRQKASRAIQDSKERLKESINDSDQARVEKLLSKIDRRLDAIEQKIDAKRD